LEVTLPIGCVDSQKVMIEEQGDWVSSEKKFGQLQVVVSILQHNFYEVRGGYDLIIYDTIDVF
jgi:DnaJ-class molecular chaperone